MFPWWIKYPVVNNEIQNLDWLLKTVQDEVAKMDTFINFNAIKYADPILWNITTQYEANTVVVDPVTGTAYISVQPVPSGIGLNNTDYWTVIFTMDIMSANKNITLRDDANNTLATFESNIGDWLLTQGNLYVVIRQIDVGEAYVPDYNIERRTVEMFLKAYISDVIDIIGDLDDLTTTDKDSVVDAINELVNSISTLSSNVGDLDDLTTTDKDSIVEAINELVSALSNLSTDIGDLDDLATVNTDSIVAAINSILTDTIGDLSDLHTTDKDSVVDAINEVVDSFGDLGDLALVHYPTVAAMKADANLAEGNAVRTLGYYAANDGGGALYRIVSSSTKYKETLNNGLYAELIYDKAINVLQVGAKGNNTDDDRTVFNTALTYADELLIPSDRTYILSSSLSLGNYQSIKGLCDRVGADKPLLKFTTGGIILTGDWSEINNIGIMNESTSDGITVGVINTSTVHTTIRNVFIYNARNGIATAGTVWHLNIEHVRLNDCVRGTLLENCKPCVLLLDVYFDHCTTNALRAYSSWVTCISCNFGFIDGCTNYLYTGTNAVFIGCNFECDSQITGTMIYALSNHFTFINCFFTMNGASTASVLETSNSCEGVILENCTYKTKTGSDPAATFIAQASGTMYRYGTIVIGYGCNSIPRPNLYTANKPNVIDIDSGKPIEFSGTTIDTTKLKAGCILYQSSSNKLCYFNGTNIVDMAGTVIV